MSSLLTDPRLVLRRWFDPAEAEHQVNAANLTIEDDTSANYESDYEMNNENRLYVLFHDIGLDLIFIIIRNDTDPIPGSVPPIGYIQHLAVQPVAIDKYDSDGDLHVSATKLIDKALQEIRRVIRTNMTGSMRLSGREEKVIESAGVLIYGDKVGVDYIQYVTSY